MDRRITLDDLKELWRRLVPAVARHPGSLERGAARWWPAHELGHLL